MTVQEVKKTKTRATAKRSPDANGTGCEKGDALRGSGGVLERLGDTCGSQVLQGQHPTTSVVMTIQIKSYVRCEVAFGKRAPGAGFQ